MDIGQGTWSVPGSLIEGNASDIVFHFPDTAGADACTETATYAQGVVNHIGIGAVPGFLSADGPVITGGLTHAAVPAYGTGHTAVCLGLGFKWFTAADVIIGGLYFVVRDDGLWCRHIV